MGKVKLQWELQGSIHLAEYYCGYLLLFCFLFLFFYKCPFTSFDPDWAINQNAIPSPGLFRFISWFPKSPNEVIGPEDCLTQWGQLESVSLPLSLHPLLPSLYFLSSFFFPSAFLFFLSFFLPFLGSLTLLPYSATGSPLVKVLSLSTDQCLQRHLQPFLLGSIAYLLINMLFSLQLYLQDMKVLLNISFKRHCLPLLVSLKLWF